MNQPTESEIVEAAGLVTREVRTGTRDETTTRIVVARRTYDTDRNDLWDAVTNPERLPRWFAPVTGDLSLGGRYQVQGNAGGVVELCDEPHSFAITWEYGETVSWVMVTLTETRKGTELELVHESPVDPDFWEEYGPGAVGVGWDLALLGLGMHVDSGEAVDREWADSFTLTPEGLVFVEMAAGGWSNAALADGDDRTKARGAAERTVAFYTTLPEDAPEQ